MAQLYGSTPANGVWVVPGTHRCGKVDIRAMVAEAGSERLPEAVPIVCRPGDVAMMNRQVLHGSFANTSSDWRVTVNFGFRRRASVPGVAGGGPHSAPAVYDEAVLPAGTPRPAGARPKPRAIRALIGGRLCFRWRRLKSAARPRARAAPCFPRDYRGSRSVCGKSRRALGRKIRAETISEMGNTT